MGRQTGKKPVSDNACKLSFVCCIRSASAALDHQNQSFLLYNLTEMQKVWTLVEVLRARKRRHFSPVVLDTRLLTQRRWERICPTGHTHSCKVCTLKEKKNTGE